MGGGRHELMAPYMVTVLLRIQICFVCLHSKKNYKFSNLNLLILEEISSMYEGKLGRKTNEERNRLGLEKEQLVIFTSIDLSHSARTLVCFECREEVYPSCT